MSRRASHPLLLLLALAAPARADEVSPEVAREFAELARRAETALQVEGAVAAARIYEEGLLGPLGEYGRISLRLGQLYQQLENASDAAFHYRACIDDERVDAVDREVLCEEGFRAVTAAFDVAGLPPRSRVAVLEPGRFAGPWSAGMRLPLGPARVVVEAPGRERATAVVEIVAPETKWLAVVGPPMAVGRRAPEATPEEAESDTSAGGGGPSWPVVALGIAGLGLVGGGVYLGFDSHSALDDTRARQAEGRCGADFCRDDLDGAYGRAKLADGLWIGGAALTVAAGVLWYLADGGGP